MCHWMANNPRNPDFQNIFKTNLKVIPYNIIILYFNDNRINFVIYLNKRKKYSKNILINYIRVLKCTSECLRFTTIVVGPNATMNRIINRMNITTTTNKLRVFEVFEFVDKSIYKIKQTYSERL